VLETVSFKLVVTGPFGVGKTTLIQAISETPVVQTEVPTTEEDRRSPGGDGKRTTTVSMDFGTRTVAATEPEEPSVELLLFGTPGQSRFSFMWEILSEGMDGLVLLVDVTDPASWPNAAGMLRVFTDTTRAPVVIGANRALPGHSVAGLSRELGLSPDVPVVPCSVVEPASAREVVLTLLEQILDAEG
jgi:signal recognition particle receptor subunit beta